MTKSVNGNLSEKQLTLEKELILEGAVDRDLEGKKEVFGNRIVITLSKKHREKIKQRAEALRKKWGVVRPLTRQEGDAVLLGIINGIRRVT